MDKGSNKSAFVLALVANVLWASSFIGSKYTLLTWGPYMAVLLRFLLSVATLLTTYRLFGIKTEVPRSGKQWGAIAVVGVILGALYPLQVGGLVFISTGLSAAIMLLAPVVLVVLAPLVGDEKIELEKTLAIGLGILGGLTLLSKNLTGINAAGPGVWLTLAAAGCLAIFTLASRKFSGLVNYPTMTLWSFAIASAVVAPFAFSEVVHAKPLLSENILKSSLALIYLAVASTAIPFFMWNKATSMTETKNLASTMHAKTPVAIVLGTIIFQESLTWQLVVGTLVVSSAVWLSQAKNLFAKTNLEKGEINERTEIVRADAVLKVN